MLNTSQISSTQRPNESPQCPTYVALRQFQIEGVEFISTQVSDKEVRAIGSNCAPPISGSAFVRKQSLQIDNEF